MCICDLLLPVAELAQTAVWLGMTAGMTRSYLSQLGKASPKISAILELSPGVERFFSESNPLQAELRECLRHTSERSLAQAYRRWASASPGENEPPYASRPPGIPVHPEQVYQVRASLAELI